jgi:hypothetical protein
MINRTSVDLQRPRSYIRATPAELLKTDYLNLCLGSHQFSEYLYFVVVSSSTT